MSFFKHARLSLFAIVCLTIQMHAQNSLGSVRGTVEDATGARVPSAKIVVQSVGSSVRREAVAEDRGEFRLDDLLPGRYRITVSAAGFAPAQAEVAVAVSIVRDVVVTLKPARTSETVNVESQSSSITTETIDTSSAVHGGVVGSQDLESLPLPARSFANIAYLVPGTEPVETLPTLPRRALRRFPRAAVRA